MNHRLLLIAVAAACVPASALAQQANAARDNINALIESQAKAAGLPSSFVHQVIKRESNYNPNAKGGSALGLMQIKHATAKGMGYSGDAAGLYDPATNLRFGIAYLAGAYRAAKGDLIQAYTYYNRGYYYAAKRLGISTNVASLETAPAAVPQSGAAFGSLFGQRPVADPNITAANTALAYAAADLAPSEMVEVPLPPRRPAFAGDMMMASAAVTSSAALSSLSVARAAASPASTMFNAVAASEPPVTESVEVPLPPRRPSPQQLASAGRPIVAKKPASADTILEASALPANQ
ncbi:MAG: transglycosylase SLT domain-containing protein [Methylobacterium sp.]|uniref:transglycosylase SLT domain-containing protein n=1 Tax=Methylobacterium sp. TaxID=409 RepID=UPI0025F6F3EA|nr:transglycosylase SLT domain-containing protein [Methylobacterium sp.]MBX9933888.1 transglycosylase SLT domain-containing protein [Methylobacterium sp.]